MNFVTDHVAIVGDAATPHGCLEDAVQHVAAASGSPREAIWFRGTPEGAFLFNAPFGEPQQPIAWITSRQRYQAAKSRGDLEDAETFLSRVGGSNLRPGFAHTEAMKKAQNHPIVYCVLSDLFLWRGKRYHSGGTFSFAPDPKDKNRKVEERKLQYHLAHGVIRLATPADGQEVASKEGPLPSNKAGSERSKKVRALAESPRPSVEPDAGNFRLLDPRTIAPSPVNPRRFFDEESMQELTESVREKGVRVAINVRPMPDGCWFLDPGRRSSIKGGMVEGWFLFDRRRFYTGKNSWGQPEQKYHSLDGDLMENFYEDRAEAEAALPRWEIIAGERRWRAARRAGVASIRAVVENMDDEEAAELQVIENDQRMDLSPIETASGYAHLLKLPGYSMAKLARRVSRAENTIYGALKLLDLPEPVQLAVARGDLGKVTAERIGRLEGDLQIKAADAILKPQGHGEDSAKALSDREAKAAIERLKNEQERERLVQAAKDRAKADGYQILEGQHARGVLAYGDQLAHNSGYVAAADVCPHDPHGSTWKEVVEQSAAFMAQNHLWVGKYAVIANSHTKGWVAVPIFARDQVNVLLKALNLWNADGSQAATQKEDKAAEKEKAGQMREAMMQDFDAIVRQAETERSPRRALLAAVWTFTDDRADIGAVEFVAKRRAWISLDGDAREANSVVRSLASDLEVRELQALVVELAIAQMGEEENYFADSREEVRGLVDPSTAWGVDEESESAGARSFENAEAVMT